MTIVPGNPVTVGVQSPPNPTAYNITALNVLRMKSEPAPNTLKYQIYYLDCIGPVYYQDRGTTILNKSYSNITGTAAISDIWNSFLNSQGGLDVQSQSSGMIGTTEQPYSITAQKPLTAIYGIMKSIVGSQFSTSGNWLLFMNRNGPQLAQLEALLTTIDNDAPGTISSNHNNNGQSEYYVQKETWGAAPAGTSWGSGFNDADLYHAIITASLETRASAEDIADASSQQQFVYDLAIGQIIQQGQGFQAPNISNPLFSGISSALQGVGQGTMAGLQVTDSSRWANPTAPWTKTPGEKAYSAFVRGAPCLILKVPLQTGLNTTVGVGIWAYLVPPTGDLTNFNQNSYLLSGAWLVTQLCHELFTDVTMEAPGTTTIRATKGSLPGP